MGLTRRAELAVAIRPGEHACCRAFSILCQYDYARVAPDVLANVAEAHDVDVSPELAPIGRDGELAAARDRLQGSLRLSGELDFGTYPAIEIAA